MRRSASSLLIVSLLFAVAACGSRGRGAGEKTTQPTVAQTPAPANGTNMPVNEQQKGEGKGSVTAKTRVNACSLIKSEELRAIQGETATETKLTETAEGSIATGHCLYVLPTYSKSLSLSLTQRDSSKGEGNKLKDFWEERFRDFEEEEKEKRGKGTEEKGKREEKREGKERAGEKEREGEEESKPLRVTGIGEEAFWVGNRMLGALYVYSKNSILRLSLGGPENEAAKIDKLKRLAQAAIKRL